MMYTRLMMNFCFSIMFISVVGFIILLYSEFTPLNNILIKGCILNFGVSVFILIYTKIRYKDQLSVPDYSPHKPPINVVKGRIMNILVNNDNLEQTADKIMSLNFKQMSLDRISYQTKLRLYFKYNESMYHTKKKPYKSTVAWNKE